MKSAKERRQAVVKSVTARFNGSIRQADLEAGRKRARESLRRLHSGGSLTVRAPACARGGSGGDPLTGQFRKTAEKAKPNPWSKARGWILSSIAWFRPQTLRAGRVIERSDSFGETTHL